MEFDYLLGCFTEIDILYISAALEKTRIGDPNVTSATLQNKTFFITVC